MSGQWVGLKRFWSIVVLAVIAIPFISIVARFIQQLEYENFRTGFVQAATDDLYVIRTNIARHLELLDAVAALCSASSIVTREEFATFVAPLLQDRASLLSVEWIPHVSADQRHLYEAALRNEPALLVNPGAFVFREGAATESIPAQIRPEYYPIYYQVSLHKDALPLGYDIGSDSTLLPALNKGVEHKNRLLTTAYSPTGFTLQILQPVELTTTLKLTDELLILPTTGFVSILLNVDKLIADTLGDITPDDVYFSIYEQEKKALLYHYPPLSDVYPRSADDSAAVATDNDLWLIEETLTIAGKEWMVTLQPTPSYLAENQGRFQWVVLIISLLLTAGLSAYLYLLLDRERHSEMIVSERTNQLHETNQQLEETLQALQFQKALLECTSEAMQDGILVVSPERKWLFFNRRFVEIWQIPPEIAAQRTSAEGMRWVLSQVENAQQVEDRIEALYAQPDINSASEVRLKNGAILERFSAPVKSADGVHLGRVWYFHDITQHKRTEEALRQSEARNRAFVNAIPDLLFRVSRDGTFLDCHSAPGYLPVMSPKEFLGRNAVDVFAPLVAQALKERIINVLSTGEIKIVEYDMPMLNGEMRSWEQRMVMLSEDEVLLIIRDITARKQAEAALRVSQQQLQERQQREKELVEEELARLHHQLVISTRFATLGQVAATIAHELRNPLGAVRNAVYYIRRYLVQDHQELLDFLQIIDVEVTTADRIITNLLEMTRAKEPGIQQLDLRVVAQEIWHRSKQTDKIVFDCTVPHEPFWLSADPTQFRQVLTNLMTNAVQAMPNGGALSITGEEQPGYVMITVQDSGSGVPATARDRIFEPLFTTKAKGTGLGLAICRQIIERHGGTIELGDSSYGAKFVIRLPVKPVATMAPIPS